MRDRLGAQAATYTTQKKQMGRISMLSAEYKLAIPGIKPLNTYA
jgi:hypothetical protein